ncbi:hypothetical protein SNE40_006712 [Patella caerulea]|uniref:Opioid growth factor receptor (OGFr) conserved domain-containing protein n=1 Tax=Patella caerulea TaxID=87958 RepID=A0AAN8PTY9_PATCE
MSNNEDTPQNNEVDKKIDVEAESTECDKPTETQVEEGNPPEIKLNDETVSKNDSCNEDEPMQVDDANSDQISDNLIGNTDDYYASGGSGSEKELKALKQDHEDVKTKPKKVVKSKTRGKTLKNQNQKLMTDYVRPTSKENVSVVNKSKDQDSSASASSDTDRISNSESDKEKEKDKNIKTKKKKMGNAIKNKAAKRIVTRSKNKSSDSDEDAWERPSRLYKRWSDRDTETYRNGYPGKKDDPQAVSNMEFYKNQIYSRPDGDKIDDIHKKWWGNFGLLEGHHGYIQWLFPIRESGMNYHAQELQLHEIKAIVQDKKAHARVLKSYEMMLDFYGMKIIDEKTGEIGRGDNWQSQFAHLNRSMHNYLRITRILKSLGEFQYEHYKAPFVKFVMKEALEEKTLKNVISSCMNYWVGTIKDDKERQELRQYAIDKGYKDTKY